MKRTIAALAFGLLIIASTALAAPITLNMVGHNDNQRTGTMQIDFSPQTGIAYISIMNTAASASDVITGFAMNLPDDGLGVQNIWHISSNQNWRLLNQPPVPNGVPFDYSTPNTITLPGAPVAFDLGVGTGANLASGVPSLGILKDNLMVFTLLFSGPGLANVDMSKIIGSESFVTAAVLFSSSDGQGGGDLGTPESCPNAPTPIPGAVWLLGSGLMGLLGLKRRRRDA